MLIFKNNFTKAKLFSKLMNYEMRGQFDRLTKKHGKLKRTQFLKRCSPYTQKVFKILGNKQLKKII